MSSDTSESDTLLASPPDTSFDDTEKQRVIDQPDLPTHFDKFLRNVAICKGLLGLALPAAAGMEIAHLVIRILADRPEDLSWGKEEKALMLRETIANAVGAALTVCPPCTAARQILTFARLEVHSHLGLPGHTVQTN